MSVQRTCFIIFTSALLLQCVFCKEKTEHTYITNEEESGSTVGNVKGWSSWEPASKTAGLNWTPAETYDSYTEEKVPKQKARTQKSQSQQKGRPVKSSAEPDININDLRKTAFKYGKRLFDFVTGSNTNLGLRTFFPDSPFSSFEGRSFEGGSRSGGGRGAIDWLARLVGVEGKTLGEFLREYQVHVLYDLVFTFFKWIFFLYAGLLIP